MNKDDKYIGTHLVMDITSYNADLLRDEGKVSRYITEVIKIADMTCIVAPQTFKFPFDNEYKKFLDKLREEGTTSPLIEERLEILDYNNSVGSGVTGFGVLAESHVAIHTFPEKKDPFMSVCLYSCKRYNPDEVIGFTNPYWDVKSNHIVVMDRFVDKPQTVRQETIRRPKLTIVERRKF